VDQDYVFETPSGPRTLADLFEGREQLIVYHLMFGPGWEHACPSCSYLMDHVDGALPHLRARNTTFVAVSRASLREIMGFQKRMGWKFPWVSSSGNSFNFDYHVSFTKEEMAHGAAEYNFSKQPIPVEELPGVSVFLRDEAGAIYHTYSSYARGLDILVGTYNYLDLTPKGRDEDGLAFSMAWVRHHDRYGDGYAVDSAAGYEAPKGAERRSCCGADHA
jgi:predicted dithiol-disulfide oxidoreductase (DUF899 family)